MQDAATNEQTLLMKAARIRLAVFDVDGVLTDGRLFYGPDGEAMKVFHSRDGLGLKALARSGVHIAVISGRSHQGVEVRLQQLGISEVHQGIEHKLPVLEELMRRLGVNADETCFTGDDWNDAPAMRAVALAFAPADATRPILHLANYVTHHAGGAGAVREICELILGAQDNFCLLEDIGINQNQQGIAQYR